MNVIIKTIQAAYAVAAVVVTALALAIVMLVDLFIPVKQGVGK